MVICPNDIQHIKKMIEKIFEGNPNNISLATK